MPTTPSGTPRLSDDATVRGEVVPRSEPTRRRADDGPTARRRSGQVVRPVVGLVRLARRLGGRARRPAAVAVARAASTAVPTAVAVASPLARAVAPVMAPVVAPVLEPVLRPVRPFAGALAGPLGKVAGDPRLPRPVLALRLDGVDLPVVPEVLARLDRDGSGRLVVMVPSTGGDERTWQRGVEATGATYGDRLAAVLGWSPLVLRYDGAADGSLGPSPGRGRLAQDALALSAILQRVVDGWPVPVNRVVLVAEGDGGLLARGALGVHQPGAHPWTDLVTELVALDVPELGTEVDPSSLAAAVGKRLEEELAGLVVVGPEVIDVPALGHVDYLLVSDRGASRPHPAGRVLGGLLRWRRRSRRVHDLFPTAERFEVSAAGRPLVNHPEVHDALLRWLA